MPDPVTIATLGDLQRHGYRLSAWCRSCDRNAPVDLDALIARWGEAFPYTRGLGLRCAACGGRDVGITVHPPADSRPISRGS